MPLAVVGSNVVIEVNGKKVRGRQYPWGVAEGRFTQVHRHKGFHFVARLQGPNEVWTLGEFTRGNHFFWFWG